MHITHMHISISNSFLNLDLDSNSIETRNISCKAVIETIRTYTILNEMQLIIFLFIRLALLNFISMPLTLKSKKIHLYTFLTFAKL